MSEMLVELVCVCENKIVARIKTEGSLTAGTILKGLEVLDPARVPLTKSIVNNTTLSCRRCHEPLRFRGGDGELVVAFPCYGFEAQR